MGSFIQTFHPGAVPRLATAADIYIAAVEAADGQSLEAGVKAAIVAFIEGCQSDGIWDAIKSSCVLAGARTLAGALVPLKGVAPTSVNFSDADYNRETGLVGDGSTKYLNANRAGNADPQNNQHVSVWLSVKDSAAGTYIGSRDATATGSTQLISRTANVDDDFTFVSQGATFNRTGSVSRLGFIGVSRSLSTEFSHRLGGSTVVSAGVSQTPSGANYLVFNRANSALYSNARLAFYSIGESIDLTLLDSRLSTLIGAIGAAIV